jgi:hypothetical protein
VGAVGSGQEAEAPRKAVVGVVWGMWGREWKQRRRAQRERGPPGPCVGRPTHAHRLNFSEDDAIQEEEELRRSDERQERARSA